MRSSPVRAFLCTVPLVTILGCNAPGTMTSMNPPPGGEPCDSLPLKTPRAPRLLWSCPRQNFLEKERAANHPYWQELIKLAERTGTSDSLYGDNGDFAALAYQVTGEQKYADAAAAQLIKRLQEYASFDGNYTREHQAEFAITYDWIQGGITQDQRDTIESALYSWVDQLLKRDPANEPIRLTDTDQTTGNYFGTMLLALATKGSNPRADELLKNPIFGGLDATESALSNQRNAVKKYLSEWAPGGVWIESAYYDIETLQLVALGVEGVRTATGEDHFPEFAGFAEAVVRSQITQITSDLQAAPKWGDVEQPRDLEAWRRYQTLGMFTGMLPADSPLRPLATKYILDLRAAHADDPVYHSRFWYFFDPLAATGDWRAELPKAHYAQGQGILFSHEGWQPNDSLFFAHLRRPPMEVDHENNQFGDFSLYRKGKWVLTRPLGYGGGSVEPIAVNAMVLGGLDAMIDRKVHGVSTAPDGSYTYFAGSAQGDRYLPPYYMPPPAFVSEWTRSFVYLPTTAKTADTIVVYDRVNAVPPTQVNEFSDDDTARVNAAPALKQWIVHTLTQPTTSATGATWSANGQQAELTALAPAQRNSTVVDEKTLNWPTDFPPDSEKHYYIALSPQASQAYDTFLNVLQVSDAAIADKPARVASADGGMEGARLSRPGQTDAVVLFSASQAQRVRATGFALTITLVSDGADLYVADLDPSKTWKVDGAALAVDSAGFGHAALSGGGMKTLNITAE